MAPGTPRIVLTNEPSFTETSQQFATGISQYTKGNLIEKRQRIASLLQLLNNESGFKCPSCKTFAAQNIKTVLEKHSNITRAGDISKAEFKIKSRPVYMYLLINPDWFKAQGYAQSDPSGTADGTPDQNYEWWTSRSTSNQLIEVRGRIKLVDEGISDSEEESEESELQDDDVDEAEQPDRKKFGLPKELIYQGETINTRKGTIPQPAKFTCSACGTQQDFMESVKKTQFTAPVVPCAIQCHCPICEEEGFNYGGRFFKRFDDTDAKVLYWADQEWNKQKSTQLLPYWPQSEISFSHMTHERNDLPSHGYTHWWKMFNTRQLLIHSNLLKAIMEAPEAEWPLDIREQALGALQQYLRMMNMFSFWHRTYDKLAPHFSNANFHPKQLVVETNLWGKQGYGKWTSCTKTVIAGLSWCQDPWEIALAPSGTKAKSVKVKTGDPLLEGAKLYCGSSTDLSQLPQDQLFDLIITDPPFGDNLYYADLADFFYAWLRIPMLVWYKGKPESAYFQAQRTPHAIEAIENHVEHPDDREAWEKHPYISKAQIAKIRELTCDNSLEEKQVNPLFRPEPASEFYQSTLSACWAEAGKLLKPAGLMAFTFHHSEDAPWVDVLEALFNAGYILEATYPIRSDETKGKGGAFGSKKIEYDIIHVCRKRGGEPQPVSWAKMRRWVKEEVAQLKLLLETSHGKSLSEADLMVMLRGKALEFYSRHYGQVYTGQDQLLSVKEALLGINQLLEDFVEAENHADALRPPENTEPTSAIFLRVFRGRDQIKRDELHKLLRGHVISQEDLEAHGWIRLVGTKVHVIPVSERFAFFSAPGRNRRVLKTDLDQAHFLIGAAMPRSSVDITNELENQNFKLKRAVEDILSWYAKTDPKEDVRKAAELAHDLLVRWKTKPKVNTPDVKQMSLFELLEAEDT